jgi:PAS domain S-box-containing protein
MSPGSQELLEYINELQIISDIIEHAENIIFAKDTNGRYTIANVSSRRYFGKSKEEVIGKTDLEIFDSEEAVKNMEIDHEILATGKRKAFEKHVLGKMETATFML